MDAVILAGGGKCAADDALCPSQYRALLELRGKPMISYVVDAVCDSGCAEKVYIVCDKAVYAPLFEGRANVELIQEGKGMLDNVGRGMRECRPGLVMLATIDIPLINGQTVRDFVAECLKTPEMQLFYPVVEQSVNEAAYPGTKRTYFRMREGNFTGGNLLLAHTDLLNSHLKKFEALLEHRKTAAKMALDIGAVTLFKMMTGRLSLEEAERRVCKVLDIKGRAVVSRAAELCLDVDKPSDYQEAVRALAECANA